jgi:hypothetical protein
MPDTLGLRELVLRLGEVIHPDVLVPGTRERTDRERHQVEAPRGRGQLGLVNAPLRLEHRRQVRVVVQRDAVRVQVQHLEQGLAEFLHRLARQAVDQVEIDGLEPARARGLDHVGRELVTLDAVDRALHVRIEVLHADRQAVEAELAKKCDRERIGAARVDLDRVLAVLH